MFLEPPQQTSFATKRFTNKLKEVAMEVTFDKKALKKAISELRLPAGEAEWCVACGAGAASRGSPRVASHEEQRLETVRCTTGEREKGLVAM